MKVGEGGVDGSGGVNGLRVQVVERDRARRVADVLMSSRAVICY